MNIEFEKMPDNSRLWIYQADRQLSEKEALFIKNNADLFLEEWAAHGAGLNASSVILYNQFLIIAVDEAMVKASGCSIDKQVQFVQALGNELFINFMDRTKVAFLESKNTPGEKEIFMTSLSDVKKRITEGIINSNTLTFNNLVQTKAQLQDTWIVPAEDSWLKRYF